MVREVRGAGTLVPEDIRWIPATTTGRIEEIVLRPGAIVKPGTVILELSNPDLEQQVNDAELAWKAAVAQLENLKASMQTTLLQQQNALADAKSASNVAQKDLDANLELLKQGIVSAFAVQQKQATVDRPRPCEPRRKAAGDAQNRPSRSWRRRRRRSTRRRHAMTSSSDSSTTSKSTRR